ncbi:MAG TPA: hypothetical protein VHV30_06800 [Polyangiaceae bacterium]|jgi:hypothetical protein|nr:hypothetical protein [Polyangiaceae bacterium]
MGALKWFAGVSFALCATSVVVQGCSSKKGDLTGDDGTNPSSSGGDDGGSSSGMTFGATSSSGSFSSGGSSSGTPVDPGPCKGGHYEGTFAGIYDSHITFIGIGIPVTGDVNLDLQQEGDSTTMCKIEGEIPEPCNEVYSLKNGTIDGTADQAKIGDAAGIGGFPYHCDMTGTLDCQNKTLVGGWIECTYCVGPIDDGGLTCTLAVGGHFAGPLVAGYDTGLLAFVNGTWNGAEALCTQGPDNGPFSCSDGGPNSDAPEGGPWQGYIQDGGYILGQTFGGSGSWNSTWKHN